MWIIKYTITELKPRSKFIISILKILLNFIFKFSLSLDLSLVLRSSKQFTNSVFSLLTINDIEKLVYFATIPIP